MQRYKLERFEADQPCGTLGGRVGTHHRQATMLESSTGEWVRFEDVKTVIEERDRAQREGVEHYEALVDLVDARDAAVKFPPDGFPPEEYQDFANACNVMAAASRRPDHWHLLAELATAWRTDLAEAQAHADAQRAIGAAQERELAEPQFTAGRLELIAQACGEKANRAKTGRTEELWGDLAGDALRLAGDARAANLRRTLPLSPGESVVGDYLVPCPGIWHGAILPGPECTVCGATRGETA